ncbi:MAG TPA: diguanylate cyclase [Candidatus Obscuribacterales bacterium]
MQGWQETFGELKDQYIRRSSERLGKIVEMVGMLIQRPSDIEVVKQLARHFHWLAGSGTMYGFPVVSALGTEGEQHCEALIRGQIQVADVDKLKNLLNELVSQFQGGDAAPVTTNLGPPTQEMDKRTASDVLIIGEDQNDLLMMCRLVEEQGYPVRSARSMATAVTELRKDIPAAVIIEIPLPDGDSYELVDQIRSMPGGEEPAILILSKRTGFLDKVRSIHCGADAHFEKPIDSKAMMRRLKYLLDKKKQEPPKILSVEDDPDQAAFIRAFLESAGYQVRTCTDPKHFESALSSFQPDLVLLDAMLPGCTGYELARFVRQDERYATLPVLFLTTQGHLEARIEAARSGGDDHLVKPVPPALLLSAVSSRLERSRFLKTLLHRDGLTSVLNHSAFMEQAQRVIAEKKRRGEFTAMIIVDVDYFRSINERHGFPGGDKVLQALSLLLRKRVRQSDIIGRLGGDEFAVIAEGLDEQEALQLATRLISDFQGISHTTPSHVGFYATLSAGVAMLDPKTMDLETWVGNAYRALKQAKENGRNCAISLPDTHMSSLR